jgi:hypothetical protein
VETFGPLPADDEEGNCYVLVVIDSLTRFVALKPTKTAVTVDAISAAKFVLNCRASLGDQNRSGRMVVHNLQITYVVEGLLKLMGINLNKHTSLACVARTYS